MKFEKYLLDKMASTLIFAGVYLVLLLMLFAFKSDPSLIAAISLILFAGFFLSVFISYYKRKRFYNELTNNLQQLDQKYLILEMLDKPNFYDGEFLYQTLYEANKSMTENVKAYEYSINDFKEYVEMWIHEVKVPISSLLLMIHNHPNQFDAKAVNQIKRVDNYIEQVLYYVRSENAEKDYLILETNLNKVIGSVAMKNKDDLLENQIELTVSGADANVLTDSKWLEFILNQIFNNSIKYKCAENSAIEVTVTGSAPNSNGQTTLSIRDNGIGIPKEDLPKVFEKSFTGHNGRIKSKSTGMGLYIAKKLCDKLGHRIEIESEEGSYTTVTIRFGQDDYFDVAK